MVQDVKKLYPVSNKDIDTLLKTKGDISTRPDALIRLIAAQMATNDIAMQSEDIAYKYFEVEIMASSTIGELFKSVFKVKYDLTSNYQNCAKLTLKA